MNEQEREAFEYYWSAENTLGRRYDMIIRDLEYENKDLTRLVENLKNQLQALKRENNLLKGVPEEDPEPQPQPQPQPEPEPELDELSDLGESLDEDWKPMRCIAGHDFNGNPSWNCYEPEEAEEEAIADGDRDVDYWRRMGNPEEGYNGRMMNIDEEPIEGGEPFCDDDPKRLQTVRFANHKPTNESKRFYPLVWSSEPSELALDRKSQEFHDVIEESVPFPVNPNATGDAFGLRSTREMPFPHFDFKEIQIHTGEPVVRENDFEKAIENIKNSGNIDDDNSDDDYDSYSVEEFEYNSQEENLEDYWKRW